MTGPHPIIGGSTILSALSLFLFVVRRNIFPEESALMSSVAVVLSIVAIGGLIAAVVFGSCLALGCRF